MRNSISKLIVAGLSLAVSTASFAVPQTVVKNAKDRASLYNVSAATKLPAPNGKQVTSLKGLTRADAPRGNRVQSVSKVNPYHKAMMPMLNAPDASDAIYAISVYSDDSNATPTGIYSISSSSADIDLIMEAELSGSTATVGKGYYYINQLDEFFGYIFGAYHYVLDVNTWKVVDVIEDDLEDPALFTRFGSDITYDASTESIYGCFFNEDMSGYIFGKQDPTTFETTKIADLPTRLNAIGATTDGRIYGIDMDGNLLQIDKYTGAITVVGNTGYIPVFLAGGTIDPVSDVFYWALSPADYNGYLMAVDINTANTEMICQYEYNNEFVGLGMVALDAAEGAPGALVDFNVAFEGALHTGEISFTMPTTDSNGEAYNQALNWTVERNGEVIKTGRDFAGMLVKFTDVVPATGNYIYRAYASNDNGKGASAKTSLWVGPENPVVPQNVAVNYANGTFNVSWDAVNDFDGDVTYRVRLYMGNAMVKFAEVSGTSCSFDFTPGENLAFYFATVEAVSGVATSDLGVTSTLVMGHANAPYIEEFEDADSLAPYTIIDYNEDGKTWILASGGIVRVTYNGSKDMDDWLITPPIRLEAGKEYTFEFSAASGSNYYKERIEALMGVAPTVEAMTSVLVDPTDLVDNKYVTLGSTFVCEETGDYYFGLHGISDADMLYLNVDYISLSAGVSTKAPVAPEVSAKADATGALNATITYTVPSTDLNGNETSVSKVVIACDGEDVVENSAVKAGQTYTAEVTVPEDGTYTYTVTAYNAYGAGRPASVSVYIGINRPATPENVNIVETTLGTIEITWDPVTVDYLGNPIDAANVNYVVVNDQNVIVGSTSETSYTYQVTTGEQDFTFVVVYAETIAGYSLEGGYSNFIPVGDPYTLPMVESFDDGSLSYPMGADGDASWDLYTNEKLGIDDFDGTNGFAAMEGSAVGDSGSLITAKVLLDADEPYLAFAYYGIADDNENFIDVFVTDCATGIATQVKHVVCNEGTTEWNPVQVSLAQYAGKSVFVTFECVVMSYTYVIIDQIKLYQPVDFDLEAADINAPATVAPGEEFNIDVTVRNVGLNPIENYSVEVINNGKVVATAEANAAITVGNVATVSVPYTLTPLDNVSNYFSAKVVCADDTNDANDLSPEVSVMLDLPVYPVVNDLAASADNGVTLTWSAPVLDASTLPKQPVLQDFESWTPLSTEGQDGWTIVDADGYTNGSMQDHPIPGIDDEATGFYTFNTETLGLDANQTFFAHSGVQYMCAVYTLGGANSDWLISPELTGKAQTISFWAKSYSSSYAESFSVYYSTTDTDLDSFVEIASAYSVPADWTNYQCPLPEGAKYFAIECNSNDRFMLFVDDVTYTPADAETVDIAIVGYNIYRNGVKINEAPVAETSYVDAEGSANDVYAVTVVYDLGESAGSNQVSVADGGELESSGIADAVVAAKVKVEARTIVVLGADARVNIYAADGKMVYSAAPAVRNAVTVVPGVYVVKTGDRVVKVSVK